MSLLRRSQRKKKRRGEERRREGSVAIFFFLLFGRNGDSRNASSAFRNDRGKKERNTEGD